MASMKRTNSMFPAYILNKTIDVNTKGYQIPILWSPTSSEIVNALRHPSSTKSKPMQSDSPL